MKKILCWFIFFCTITATCYGDYGFSAGCGTGINGELVSNIGITSSISDKLYYEIQITNINKIFVFSICPMIRFKKQLKSYQVFCEFGIGGSYFSQTIIGNRDLSTNLLFEDKIGIGVTWKNIDIAVRVIHYSNCSVKPPNDGFELICLKITQKF